MVKKIIIIGAGISGLSAGSYLEMNGYDTEIFEAHNIPGGLCTCWKRKDYLIEGCIHGLLGSEETHPYYHLWNEVIDMDEIDFINQDVKETYYFPDGKEFIKYADLEKLSDYMKEIAPEDSKIINEFIQDTKKFQSVEMPVDKAPELYNIFDYIKMIKSLPLLLVMKKWNKINAGQFAKKFKNPFLKKVVKHFSSPVLFEMFVLSEMDLKRCGYLKFDTIIIISPLYIHSMPGIVMKFIEELQPATSEGKHIGFIVQAGFIETAQHRFVERYFKDLAKQLNYNYLGTVSKGEAAGIYMYPWMFKKVLKLVADLGKRYEETYTFDKEIVKKLGEPYELSKFKLWLLRLVNKIGLGNVGWHKVLKKNNAFDKRLDKPFI